MPISKSVKSRRDPAYEQIRVIAMCLTVGAHCTNSIPRNTVTNQYIYDALTTLLFTSNGLFFMLSGKFALAAKCDSPCSYYRYYANKLIALGIPILFYMFLRTLYDNGGIFWHIDFLKTYVKNVMYDYSGIEYWFLYTLLGLVLLAPFLGKMAAGLSKTEIYIFLFMGLLYNCIITYGPYFHLSFSWSFLFGSWVFYFFLGYFLEKIIDTPKKEKQIVLLGISAFIVSFILKQLSFTNGIHDLAPTYTLIVCAMFFLLKKELPIKNAAVRERFSTFIVKYGKYTFSVYMTHNPVRRILADAISLPADKHYLLSWFLLTVCTVIICSVLAFICENTFVRTLQRLVGKLMRYQR